MPASEPFAVQLPDGRTEMVPPVFAGAEGRYEDWVYLIMIEREWKRPLTEADQFLSISESHRPAARAVVVLVFWTYFETRMERLFREALRGIPDPLVEDMLRRYASVGSRIDRLYRTVFSTTYWADLKDLGFESVSMLLQRVQQRRNDFVHGKPEAIDDALVTELVHTLQAEHEGWIAVFNKRATRHAADEPRDRMRR